MCFLKRKKQPSNEALEIKMFWILQSLYFMSLMSVFIDVNFQSNVHDVPKIFRRFHLKLQLWGRLTSLLQPLLFSLACCFRAIWWPISIFPHHIPRVLTPSLKIAAGFVSTLGSSEREESEVMTCNKGHIGECVYVPAELLKCASAALGADLVRDHCWWMSWDDVWPKTAASIFTHRLTGGLRKRVDR